MTITQTVTQSNVVLNRTFGAYLDSAVSPAAATFQLDFVPTYIRWLDATARIQYEWYSGMANGTTLKTVAAGTRTLDTGDGAISVTSTITGGGSTAADNYPPRVKPTCVVTIGTGTPLVQNDQCYFEFRE